MIDIVDPQANFCSFKFPNTKPYDAHTHRITVPCANACALASSNACALASSNDGASHNTAKLRAVGNFVVVPNSCRAA